MTWSGPIQLGRERARWNARVRHDTGWIGRNGSGAAVSREFGRFASRTAATGARGTDRAGNEVSVVVGRACKKALVTYQGLGGNALLEVVDVEGTAGGEVLLDALEGRLDDGLGVAAGLDGHRRAAGWRAARACPPQGYRRSPWRTWYRRRGSASRGGRRGRGRGCSWSWQSVFSQSFFSVWAKECAV